MIAVLLASVGAFFEEVAGVLGKRAAHGHLERVYAMGFMNAVWTTAAFALALAAFPERFVFSPASLPTLTLRILLEVAQGIATLAAIALADRSAFNFLRTLTLPLLLGVDLALGYEIDHAQTVGIVLIILGLLALSANGGIRGKARSLVLFTAVNAVVTISLFKYDISRWNSVEVEQLVVNAALAVAFFAAIWRRTGGNPLRTGAYRPILAQSASHGVGGAIESFAYAFAPASVATAAKRSAAVLWSVLSGHRYFHEKQFGLKLAVFAAVSLGISLLAA
jgi:hypothetical protein